MKRTILAAWLSVIAFGPALAEAPQIAPAPAVAPTPAVSPAPVVAPAPAVAPSPAVTQVSPQALLEMQASKDPTLFLLDVRTTAEFAAGHVPGAVNIPYDQVAAHLGDIPKQDEVVLYCHSGRRAGLAAEVLAAQGYTRLAHLEGDMQGWTAAGRPVETSAPPAAAK